MEVIRILSARHYDSHRGRFTSLAFKNSSGQRGISVIGKDCVSQHQVSICGHIRTFYPGIAGDPPIYWSFETDGLPCDVRIEQQDSERGDRCHYNLHGLDDNSARTFLKGVPLSEFRICENGSSAPATSGQLAKIQMQY